MSSCILGGWISWLGFFFFEIYDSYFLFENVAEQLLIHACMYEKMSAEE